MTFQKYISLKILFFLLKDILSVMPFWVFHLVDQVTVESPGVIEASKILRAFILFKIFRYFPSIKILGSALVNSFKEICNFCEYSFF